MSKDNPRISRRLYVCRLCSMIYWGHELLPEARSFPPSIFVPCPTPGCSGSHFIGQASPGEAGRIHGLIIGLVVFGVLMWALKWGLLYSMPVAVSIAMIVTLISRKLHQPRSMTDDQQFAAHQVAEIAEQQHRSGQFQKARYAFERAEKLLGHDVDLKLEASIVGHLANVERERGDFATARRHYERALTIAEQIHDISGMINRHNNIGVLLGDDLRDPIAAIPHVKKALELAQRINDRQRVCRMLIHLTKRQREADQIDQAVTHVEEGLRMARSMSHNELMVEALHERACLRMAQKENELARTDLKEALRYLGTAGGSRRQHIQEALRIVCAAIKDGATVTVGSPGEQYEGRELPFDLNPEAEKALTEGMSHMMAGRLEQAVNALSAALLTSPIENDPKARSMARSNLGDILRVLGRNTEAEIVLRQALADAREAAEPHLDCQARLNLAIILRVKGAWAESREHLEQALSLAENHGIPFMARIHVILGDLYRDSADFVAAIEHYEEARGLASEERDREVEGSIEQSLGNLYFKQQLWDQARPHFEQAKTIAEQTRDARLQGIAIHMLGNVFRHLGDLRRAIELLQQSVAIEEVCPSEVARAGRLNDLATTEQDYGQVSQALEHFHQTVQLYRKHSIINPDVAGCMENLGVLLVRCGKIEEGRDIMLEASRMDNSMIAQAFIIASEYSRLLFLARVDSRLSDIISLVAAGGPLANDAATVRACADIVIRRKGSTLDALSLQRDLVANCKDPELVDAIKELAQVRTTLARMKLAGQGYHWNGSLTPEATKLTAQQSYLEQQIVKYIPFIALDEQLQRADAKAVTHLLPKGSSLIEILRFKYFDFPPPDRKPYWIEYRYIAVILTADRGGDVLIVDLGDAETIDQMVTALREKLSEYDKTGIVDIGKKLRRVVFDPLIPALKGCTRLMIAPDSILTCLPFEILPTEDGRYLIDQYIISYLSASRDLLRLNATTQSKINQPLVIADPDFDLSNDVPYLEKATEKRTWHHSRHLGNQIKQFSRLKNLAVEGKRIAEMLDVQPWLREAALKSRLTSYSSPWILHLATHGFFLYDQEWRKVIFGDRSFNPTNTGVYTDSQQPAEVIVESPLLRSGVALAGANTFLRYLRGESPESPPPSAEDGILTAEDVTGMNLFGTELVVLSACETGLGVLHTGEGVFGLRRAFVQAGAKTLVMSLWCVHDKATMELMVEFYRRLLANKGKGRAEALREAQLKIRDQYPNPSIWGAFICQGDISAMN